MNRKQQEAKKYLSQAFGLNQRIESKLNQIEELHNLAAKVTAAYSDMPKSPNRDGSRMEDTVCRIIDLESEINQDIFDKIYRKMTDLKKKEFMRTFIKAIELYPKRDDSGRIIKQISFKFPVYYNGCEGDTIRLLNENTVETVCLLARK